MDLDDHQGDGIFALFCSDARVFTLGVHGKSKFHAQKQKSDLNIELEDGTSDNIYLKCVLVYYFLSCNQDKHWAILSLF